MSSFCNAGFIRDIGTTRPLLVALNGEVPQQLVVPESFGRTHFIIGMSESEMQTMQQQQKIQQTPLQDSSLNSLGKGQICHAFFSPDDGLEEILIDLIDHEQKSLHIAVFAFTDIEIARALKRAKERGVTIEIVTDPSCLQDRFNKIMFLKEHKFSIYIYNNDYNKATLANRMHHKFVIFGKNIANKKLIWLGSYNFTKSANAANQESIVLIENPLIIEQFTKQFSRLKQRSVPFDSFAKNHFIATSYKPAENERATKKARLAQNKKPSKLLQLIDQITVA
jgi:phosphatidylserine/phosphatidylglycerophosphate/cardiolipin synthase-like enzyme